VTQTDDVNNHRLSERRLLAIGDIHGCLDLLDGLLDRIVPTSDDILVFLGDYIDRGGDSPGVIDLLLELQKQFPATVFLKGNHEQMLLQYLAGSLDLGYLMNGGITTLQQYEHRGTPRLPDHHLEFLNRLQISYVRHEHIFVHAGLKPGRPLARQTEDDMLWIRHEFLAHPNPCEWDKVIVHGHTPQETISFTSCRIGLDTGAVYGRQLSCCDVLTNRTWQYP